MQDHKDKDSQSLARLFIRCTGLIHGLFHLRCKLNMATLNQKQQQAVNEITSKKHKIYALTGAGGVGKTFTVQNLPSDWKIAYTAPTNQAVSVLMEAGCDSVHCMTIYKLMALKINEFNGVVTVEKGGKCKAGNYDLIVIDEASMIERSMNQRIIEMAASYLNLNIVLMGDKHQLPPVGEENSEAFDMATGGIELTEQMRQEGLNHPMHPLLKSIRTSIDNPCKIDFNLFSGKVIDKYGNNNSVISTRNSEQFNSWIKRAYIDDTRGYNNIIVAYTNDKVDYYNEMIHYEKNKDSIYPFVIGDELIVQSPVLLNAIYKIESKNIISNTVYRIGDKILVDNMEDESEDVMFLNNKFTIEYLNITDKNSGIIIKCLKDRNKFKSWYKNQCNYINTIKADYKEISRNWAILYSIRDCYADVRLGYSCTVYKAQGTTCDNVFIDMVNIESMIYHSNLKSINKGIYVASSRARFNVIALVK